MTTALRSLAGLAAVVALLVPAFTANAAPEDWQRLSYGTIGLRISVPPDWEVLSRNLLVVAESPSGDARLVFGAFGNGPRSLDGLIDWAIEGFDIELAGDTIELEDLNGLSGVIDYGTQNMGDGSIRSVVVLGFVRPNSKEYGFAVVSADPTVMEQELETIVGILRSAEPF